MQEIKYTNEIDVEKLVAPQPGIDLLLSGQAC